MSHMLDDTRVDVVFRDLVAGIEELEDLQAPGWGSFWAGFTIGATFAGAVVGGIALT